MMARAMMCGGNRITPQYMADAMSLALYQGYAGPTGGPTGPSGGPSGGPTGPSGGPSGGPIWPSMGSGGLSGLSGLSGSDGSGGSGTSSRGGPSKPMPLGNVPNMSILELRDLPPRDIPDFVQAMLSVRTTENEEYLYDTIDGFFVAVGDRLSSQIRNVKIRKYKNVVAYTKDMKQFLRSEGHSNIGRIKYNLKDGLFGAVVILGAHRIVKNLPLQEWFAQLVQLATSKNVITSQMHDELMTAIQTVGAEKLYVTMADLCYKNENHPDDGSFRTAFGTLNDASDSGSVHTFRTLNNGRAVSAEQHKFEPMSAEEVEYVLELMTRYLHPAEIAHFIVRIGITDRDYAYVMDKYSETSDPDEFIKEIVDPFKRKNIVTKTYVAQLRPRNGKIMMCHLFGRIGLQKAVVYEQRFSLTEKLKSLFWGVYRNYKDWATAVIDQAHRGGIIDLFEKNEYDKSLITGMGAEPYDRMIILSRQFFLRKQDAITLDMSIESRGVLLQCLYYLYDHVKDIAFVRYFLVTFLRNAQYQDDIIRKFAEDLPEDANEEHINTFYSIIQEMNEATDDYNFSEYTLDYTDTPDLLTQLIAMNATKITATEGIQYATTWMDRMANYLENTEHADLLRASGITQATLGSMKRYHKDIDTLALAPSTTSKGLNDLAPDILRQLLQSLGIN
jgi:hypothetical protein